uniref:UspA domain-containing protein n=1 Tax=Arion vulgaris TaxID=1028688 RepID=A0A0B6XZ49_9EUPU
MAEQCKQRVVAIAVDESQHSINAFEWYCDYIRKDGDYLLLIHVPETYDLTLASPSVVEQLLKELEVRVDNLERKYRDKLLARGISGKFRTTSGKPGEKIVSLASEENATFIITGTRGLGKFRRTIMGSVSDYIVHHASVPVLVCRWKTSEDAKP